MAALIVRQDLIEEHLSDGRDWLMDTETPSLADMSVHYVWEWMLEFRALRYMKDLFDPAVIPATTAVCSLCSSHWLNYECQTNDCGLQWISRVSAYVSAALAEHKPVLDTISGARAAEMITAAVAEDPQIVGFDEAEAARIGLKRHQIVSVTPADNGKRERSLPTRRGYRRLTTRFNRQSSNCRQAGLIQQTGGMHRDPGHCWECILPFPKALLCCEA